MRLFLSSSWVTARGPSPNEAIAIFYWRDEIHLLSTEGHGITFGGGWRRQCGLLANNGSMINMSNPIPAKAFRGILANGLYHRIRQALPTGKIGSDQKSSILRHQSVANAEISSGFGEARSPPYISTRKLLSEPCALATWSRKIPRHLHGRMLDDMKFQMTSDCHSLLD